MNGKKAAKTLTSINHENDLEALLLEDLKEGGVANAVKRLASEVVDVLLDLRHAGNIVLERDELVARLGGVVAQELGKLGAVGRVLMDTKLEVLAKGLVEFL